MADLDSALVQRLTVDHAGTKALIDKRAYPLMLPQKPTYPCCRFQQVGGDSMTTLRGPNGLAQPLTQIDCFAKKKSEANALAKQVRLALNGWKGTAAGVRVRSSRLSQKRETYETDTQIFCVSLDFNILHDEELS